MLFNLGMSAETPKLIKWGYEDLEDSPDQHRWRAWWESYNGAVVGIRLEAYPVIRKTECGAWITEFAYREVTKQPWEEGAPGYQWRWDENCKSRFVYDDSSAAWAKPSQEEAVHSLAVRLTRWTGHLSRETARARSAIETLRNLYSKHQQYADKALEILK